MSASHASCAKTTQASGPIPAGSPDVMTIRGIYTTALHLHFNKGLVAQPAQPQLGFLIRLAFADGGECALAAHIIRAVIGGGAQHLHDVPAIPGLERRADLVVLEIGDCLVEFRYEGAGS